MEKPTSAQELLERVRSSTSKIRGANKSQGQDTLLFLNTQYESFPVFLQQETLISSNAKVVFNNLWIWAKTKQAGSAQASLFPGYEYINRATGLSKGTIASCITQLRLQRYITLAQKVRSEKGYSIGNDYILNDEPMGLADTLLIDQDYIDYANDNINHRHQNVAELAKAIISTIEQHVQSTVNPFESASHLEKIDTRQQAAEIIQQRLYPEHYNENENTATHYFGMPIDIYKDATHRVHKVNQAENEDVTKVHKVNSGMNCVKNNKINPVHKVNSGIESPASLTDDLVHKVNPVVNAVVNPRSSSFYINTPTTENEFTEQEQELIYPEFKTANELAICKLHIAKLNREHQQSILDELSARMASKKKEPLANPIGYLSSWLIKNLNEGGIPFTSEGAQLAASRDNPERKQNHKKHHLHERIRELEMNARHLERMIGFELEQSREPKELSSQLQSIQNELEELHQRRKLA
ncbi:MAG: hypothetical protein HKN34_06180 [Gammaproteobacteria bacterium]|nr:hypothetical protein [Gammaproteobacteria bacterium]